MTRAITLAALTCFLLAGAAITAILGRDSLPAAQADIGPVANRASKQDKLAVTTLATAAFEAQYATLLRRTTSVPTIEAYRTIRPSPPCRTI